MGSGKTTIGRMLAERLGWEFADLDAEIEAQQKMLIADIFDRRGETEFRRIETEVLRERMRSIDAGQTTVVALGGGAFVQSRNLELCQASGVTVWLDVPLEVARRRVARNPDRPLARDPERFAALYESRRAAYSRADYRVPIASDDPADAVNAILNLLVFD
jgi:shikimate kinase